MKSKAIIDIASRKRVHIMNELSIWLPKLKKECHQRHLLAVGLTIDSQLESFRNYRNLLLVVTVASAREKRWFTENIHRSQQNHVYQSPLSTAKCWRNTDEACALPFSSSHPALLRGTGWSKPEEGSSQAGSSDWNACTLRNIFYLYCSRLLRNLKSFSASCSDHLFINLN